MKKYFYIFLGIVGSVTTIGCAKSFIEEDKREGDVSLKAYVTNNYLTKSSYALNGDKYEFSWVADDKFIVQTLSGSTYGSDLFTASTGGRTASFTGTVTDDYSIQNYAFYPNDGTGATSYTTNFSYLKTEIVPVAVNADVSAATSTVFLAGTITENKAYPMAHIPMIGVKDSSGDFAFTPCTGVLMVTITNLPVNTTQIRLDSSTYPLNGNFVFDVNNEIKSGYSQSWWGQKYMNITIDPSEDSDSDGYVDSPRSFFFPIPSGTIPAGKLTVSVYNGDTRLESRKNKVDIVLTKGTVTEMPAFDAKVVLAENNITASITGTSREPYVTFTYDSSEYDEVRYDHAQTWYDSYVGNKVASASGAAISIANDNSVRRTIGWAGYRNGVRRTEIKTMYYYPISASDLEKYVTKSPHSMTGVPSGGSGKLAFSLSDDPTKGQLILEDFDGMTRLAASTSLSQGHPFFTAMVNGSTYWMGGAGDSYYTYSSSKVADGEKYYGIINAGSIVFNSFMPVNNTKTNYDGDNYPFFVYKVDGSNSAKIFLSTTIKDYQAPLTFSISDETTLTAVNVKVRFYGTYCTSNGSASSSTPGSTGFSQATKTYAPSVTVTLTP